MTPLMCVPVLALWNAGIRHMFLEVLCRSLQGDIFILLSDWYLSLVAHICTTGRTKTSVAPSRTILCDSGDIHSYFASSILL